MVGGGTMKAKRTRVKKHRRKGSMVRGYMRRK